MSRLEWLFSRLDRTLSVKVSLYALLGVAAAAIASLFSHYVHWAMPFDITPSAIESLLGIIASSMLTVTTFSVNALTSAYSSATSNGTPRATILQEQDRLVQSVLATFIGSFLFSIVALIALKVSAYGPEGRAVLFLVTIAIIVLIVLALIRWIGHLAKLGRVGDTIDRLEKATKGAMTAWMARPYLGGAPLREEVVLPPATGKIEAGDVGYIAFIDTGHIAELCEEKAFEAVLQVLPGAFVYRDSILLRLHGGTSPLDPTLSKQFRNAFVLRTARSFDQDPRFGLITLTEVALRALSPAVNDPGTAIDVIGRQTRLMTLWCTEHPAPADTEPRYPRLHVPPLACGDLYEDAFNLIGRDGAGQIDVALRLLKALEALSRLGPPTARAAAIRQFHLAFARAETTLPTEHERARLCELRDRFTGAA